jgi:hypothetical protein
MRWRAKAPKGMLIDCRWKQRRLSIDLLACLEEGGRDALGAFVTRPIVECVSSIGRVMGGILGILGLESKLVDSVPHLCGDSGKQRAGCLEDHGERWREIYDRCEGFLHGSPGGAISSSWESHYSWNIHR